MAVIERRDAATLEQWDTDTRIYRRHTDGVLVEERGFTESEHAAADEWIAAAAARALDEARQAEADRLRAQARQAFTNNQTYLSAVAAGTATNATHIAQVPALTRQMQAVIRLLVGSDLLDQPATPPST